MSQSTLASAWLATTKDSSIVDIRAVGNLDQLSQYVTKYVTKPASASVYKSIDDLHEAINALHGRRMLITFGKWYGVDFLRSDSNVLWEPIDRLDTIITKARGGDAAALRTLILLRKDEPCQTETARPPPGTDS